MFAWEFYHGTSKLRFDQIKKHGFRCGPVGFRNWLAPSAVYLVVNRPGVALKFAEDRASEDDSTPVVLRVTLSATREPSILNLTTDGGMSLLYEAYEGNRKKLRERQKLKVSLRSVSDPVDSEDYDASVQDAEDDLCTLLTEACDTWRTEPARVNWDTLAVYALQFVFDFSLVVAVIQAGTTFNRLFARTEPRYRNVPSYRGIRVRDHIEVCVLDPSLIDLQTLHEVRTSELGAGINERFLKILSVPLLPDGEDS